MSTGASVRTVARAEDSGGQTMTGEISQPTAEPVGGAQLWLGLSRYTLPQLEEGTMVRWKLDPQQARQLALASGYTSSEMSCRCCGVCNND